jgi:endonuclease III related protein
LRSDEKIRALYDHLLAAHGQQGWWPAETPFEVCVGAILTQNTNWKNVEKAIANLKAALALTPAALWNLPEDRLAELIRPAGYFRLKAARLRNFLRLIVEQYDGSLERLFDLPTDELRRTVLGVRGVGRETADSIVLYAAERPVFVVDAYTLRIAFRHSLVDEDCDYDMLQETFTMALQRDVELFKEFHALLVRAGKEHCKKRVPACDGCPLATMLEDGEPRELF